MRLPNLVEHDTLHEVSQQSMSWIPLLNIKCHPDTQLFLCSLFSPVCLERWQINCKNFLKISYFSKGLSTPAGLCVRKCVLGVRDGCRLMGSLGQQCWTVRSSHKTMICVSQHRVLRLLQMVNISYSFIQRFHKPHIFHILAH